MPQCVGTHGVPHAPLQATMNAAMMAEAIGRLKAKPPSWIGLSKKSPTVAPSGRVRMKAAQNRPTYLTFAKRREVWRSTQAKQSGQATYTEDRRNGAIFAGAQAFAGKPVRNN